MLKLNKLLFVSSIKRTFFFSHNSIYFIVKSLKNPLKSSYSKCNELVNIFCSFINIFFSLNKDKIVAPFLAFFKFLSATQILSLDALLIENS
jgi:hypothetical protein